MFKYINKKLFISLEIGDYNLKSLISEILPNNKLSILGIGVTKTKGIENGKICNINLFIKCVKNIINKIEIMSKIKINSLFLVISGNYVNCIYEYGMILLKGKEITNNDICKVIKVAKSVKLSNDYTVLHVVPLEYTVDSNKGIKNPLGLSGMRMKVKVLLIICNSILINNFIRVFLLLNIKIKKIIFSGLISNYSLLTKEEKKSDVYIVDIGSSITTINFYHLNSLSYFKIFPYGGNLVTNDISYILNLSKLKSEFIKINYSSLDISLFNKNKDVKIFNFISKKYFYEGTLEKTLFNIIKSRYIEILYLINKKIIKLRNKLSLNYKYSNFCNVILSGGFSQIPGLLKYAKKIFNFNVRIGIPKKNINNISYLLKDRNIFISSFANIISSLLYIKNIYLDKNVNNFFFPKKIFFLKKIWNFFFNKYK